MDFVQNKLINALGSKNLAGNFYLGICELFFELDVDGQEFVDDFVLGFLNEAKNKVSTKGEIYLKTGFTRSQISKYMRGDFKRSSNSEKNLYHTVLEHIKNAAKKNPDKTIPITRATNSFSSIFYSISSSSMVSSKMVLESLISRGFLEKIDKNTIRLVSSTPTNYINTPEKVLQVFCDLTYRISKTLIRNLHAEKGEELFQRSFMSDRIHPDKYEYVESNIKSILSKAYKDCQKMIDDNEVKDELSIKQVENLGQELGFSAFIFNNKK